MYVYKIKIMPIGKYPKSVKLYDGDKLREEFPVVDNRPRDPDDGNVIITIGIENWLDFYADDSKPFKNIRVETDMPCTTEIHLRLVTGM